MGKVVEVSPSSVSVETDGGRFRFSNNGKECDINGKEYDVGFGPECGPWELDDMPFAERTALLEQERRDWDAKISEAQTAKKTPNR
jgi:hypothetical protein